MALKLDRGSSASGLAIVFPSLFRVRRVCFLLTIPVQHSVPRARQRGRSSLARAGKQRAGGTRCSVRAISTPGRLRRESAARRAIVTGTVSGSAARRSAWRWIVTGCRAAPASGAPATGSPLTPCSHVRIDHAGNAIGIVGHQGDEGVECRFAVVMRSPASSADLLGVVGDLSQRLGHGAQRRFRAPWSAGDNELPSNPLSL